MAGVLLARPAMADPPYRIIDLGPLGFTADPDRIGTFDINDHNQVAYGLADASSIVRPTVWLPESAYGIAVPLGGGTVDLLTAFGIDPEDWSTGIAFDINDDGIVVGQVGGFARNVEHSRAAWWNLNTMTWGTIEPQGPITEDWQDWSRAIAVSEGASPQILVETWDETVCSLPCGFSGTAMVGLVGTATVPLGATVVGSVLRPAAGDCFTAGMGRDLRAGASGTEVVGSGGLEPIRSICTNPFPDDCQPFTIGYRWLGGVETALPDLDAAGQDRGSQARGLADDGLFVGWGFDVRPFPDDCFQRPLVWSSPSSSPLILETPTPSLGLQFRAEGVTEPQAGGRLAVGWNSFDAGAVRWHDDGTTDWAFTDLQNGTAVDFGTCSVTSLSFAFDVSTHDWIVVGGRSADIGFPWHTYVLVPMTPSGCPIDIDGDGSIGLSDLLIVLSSWGGCEPCQPCPADLDANNDIGFGDVLLILQAWGDCTGASGEIPQTVEDCFEKFGSDPIALEACLQAIGANP